MAKSKKLFVLGHEPGFLQVCDHLSFYTKFSAKTKVAVTQGGISHSSTRNQFISNLIQTGKYVVPAEDHPRASNLPYAQRPIKRTEFERYT